MSSFDCETVGSVFPRQPVNALSSVAFVVAAAVLWRRGHRSSAVAVGAAGLGSILFHAAPSSVASLVHDVGLYAAVLAAAVHVARTLSSGRLPLLATGTFLAGGAVWLLSRTGGPLCIPHSPAQGHAAWHLLASLALVLLFTERKSRPAMAVAG